jgi:tetratricopeptide (TPR) repeat protein
MQIASETALSLSQFHLGELAAARRHADSGRTIYETHAQTHGPHSLFMIGQDPRVACLSCDALSSALLGDLDRARDRVTQALSIARAEAHLFSLGAAMTWTAFIAYLRGDSDAISLAGETIAMASRNRFGMWEGLARVVLGACEMSSGDPAGAEQEIACGVDLLDDAGTLLFRPFAFASRAEALLRLGDHATALELTVQGLEMTTRRRERWYNAELHRVRAEALRTLPGGEDLDGARRELAAAREVARALGERTLELRVATTAASWLAGEGDRLAAARELAPAVESMGRTGAPVVKLAAEALMSLSASV